MDQEKHVKLLIDPILQFELQFWQPWIKFMLEDFH